VDNQQDIDTIRNLVGLKERNPNLKVILSLGGWGGCKTCSDVFSSQKGIDEFSESVLELTEFFHTDGLDLDWEYPAIEGYPSHQYMPEDKVNFTNLVRTLRKTLGNQYELSFAVGGFPQALMETTDWNAVMKEVNRVHLMSYDLINDYSTVTGHHTALYSTRFQNTSTEWAVEYLILVGVPRNKIVIGAAFYARVWEDVSSENNGLYQAGKFKAMVDYKDFDSRPAGFEFYWDEVAHASYAYNSAQKLFATFDDKQSIQEKTQYALDQNLNGIMFWQLAYDTLENELVDTIHKVKLNK
jgi:chitinase